MDHLREFFVFEEKRLFIKFTILLVKIKLFYDFIEIFREYFLYYVLELLKIINEICLLNFVLLIL